MEKLGGSRMSNPLPTVGEVEALIKAEDDAIAAAQERRRVLKKQLTLSREMGQITEPNEEGTTQRIVESDQQQDRP
jgi:hypothetical protein